MEIEQVPAPDWQTWVEQNDAVILDVREPYEWELGTLPGAVKLPMGELPGSLEELDRQRPTLLVCRTGSRSHHAALYLTLSGFERAANLAGGLHALGMQ